MNCKKILPEFFGFEGVGILFRDHESENLFTIEQDELEGDSKIIETKSKRKLTDTEQVQDAERQYRQRSKCIYPNSMGITGKAFSSGKVIHSNKVANLAGFIPSIDNLTSNVKDVHSIMIVPIFGHKSKTEEELAEVNPATSTDEVQKPIAIMQFINKIDLKQIDDYDLVSNNYLFDKANFSVCICLKAKIEAMRDLLGMTIDNASRHHSAINISVGVQQTLPEVDKFAAKSQELNEEMKHNLTALYGC